MARTGKRQLDSLQESYFFKSLTVSFISYRLPLQQLEEPSGKPWKGADELLLKDKKTDIVEERFGRFTNIK